MDKIWANSADSHFVEPDDLWRSQLPERLSRLLPRSEKDADGEWETVYVDGQSFRRKLPSSAVAKFVEDSQKPRGARDASARLGDLDKEGIWGELVFPTHGMWNSSFSTAEVLRAVVQVSNDWAVENVMKVSSRYVVTAQVSTLSVDDAVAELRRCAELGFKAVFLPTRPNPQQEDWHRDVWEPFWAAAEEVNMVLAFHIGSDPALDISEANMVYRGPGGAVLNYTETTFSGQRAIMKLVASGALDRHPRLRVLCAEGGATWVPFLGDRMIEGYRQHYEWVRPKLKRDPKETLYTQVYASFQHDETAVAAYTAMGYKNVLFGSDYPHMEGTFGHTQETLRNLFDGVDDEARYRMTIGAFLDLFPDVGEPPEALM